MSDVIFEAGDVVTCAFFGDKEFVLKSYKSSEYPLCFIASDKVRSFTVNGKAYTGDTHPVLKLVRKKSKERELVECFRVKHVNDSFDLNVTDSYDSALAWIKLRGNPIYVYQIEKFYKVKE